MENRQKKENEILERLNQNLSIHLFIQEVIVLITESVDQLMLKVFRKDDYAVKYAVEPLLEGDGPLGQLSIRLKLLFALGAISREVYEDIELLLALNEVLSSDETKRFSFIDDEILGSIEMLHCINPLPKMMLFNLPEDQVDLQLVDLQKERYQRMVKSSLVLSVTSLIAQILDTDVF
ncbi:MltR family transcriptional regulator [Providencia sneebia]|uniref:Mannitol repressor protein n=1 Tax=Providencia sneebia DSM 19967 TaxID=1141660 RepID=K8W573_9GAMM|nr:mannitol repressor protein [Providencia sneebia DSM 19967]